MNGVPNIEEVSGSLIELMRGVLGNSSEFLTVREELDYVERYISIVKYRYMEPIRMVTQVEDDALLECRVLKLMLQPLVENAVIHGIGAMEQEGLVLIRVCDEGSDLKIEVIDNGKGITEGQRARLLGETGKKGKPPVLAVWACGVCMSGSFICTAIRTASSCTVSRGYIRRPRSGCRKMESADKSSADKSRQEVI